MNNKILLITIFAFWLFIYFSDVKKEQSAKGENFASDDVQFTSVNLDGTIKPFFYTESEDEDLTFSEAIRGKAPQIFGVQISNKTETEIKEQPSSFSEAIRGKAPTVGNKYIINPVSAKGSV